MSLAEWLQLASWSQRGWVVFLEAAAKGGVVLLVAGLLVLSLRRTPARTRQLVWGGALVAALALPVASLLLPGWSMGWLSVSPEVESPAVAATDPPPMTLSVQGATGAAVHTLVFPDSPRPPSHVLPAEPLATLGAMADEVPVGAGSLAKAPSALRSLPVASLTLWALGAFLLLSRQAVGLLRLRGLARRGHRAGPAWQRTLEEQIERVGIQVPIRLLLSSEAGSPMTWGARHPMILLPAGAAAWSAERRQVVLAHELIHVQRRDWLLRCWARVACALHWFNPLAWLALRRLSIEQEAACDEAVLSLGTQPTVYAQHLLAVARSLVRRASTPSVALGMARRGALEGRLMSILKSTHESRQRRSWIVPAMVLLFVAVVALAAVEPIALAGERGASEDLSAVLVELRDLRGEMEPFEDRLEAIADSMEPFETELEGLEEAMEAIAEGLGDMDGLADIEAEMEPFQARLEALASQMEPFEDRMEAIASQMEPFEDRLESLQEAEMAEFEAQMEALEEQMEPYRERLDSMQEEFGDFGEEIEAIVEEMEGTEGADREALEAKLREVESRFEPSRHQMEAIHEEMRPYYEKLSQLAQAAQPSFQRMGNLQEEMRPFYEQMQALQLEMQPLYEEMTRVHEEMRPLYQRMTAQHQSMQPYYDQIGAKHEEMRPHYQKMQEVHTEMEPYYRRMGELHERLASALSGQISEILGRELGGYALQESLAEAADEILEEASLHIDDEALHLLTEKDELREILQDAVRGSSAEVRAAVARAIEAIDDLEIEIPPR